MARLCFSLYYTINIYSSWQQRERNNNLQIEKQKMARKLGKLERREENRLERTEVFGNSNRERERGEWERATAAGHAIELMPVGRTTMLRCIAIE